MNKKEIEAWPKKSPLQQIKALIKARKELKLTQSQLGDELKIYGYKGGVATVQSWEQGVVKIPVLVFDLVESGFAERGKI